MDQNENNNLFNFDNPPPEQPPSGPQEPPQPGPLEPGQEPGGAQIFETPASLPPAEQIPIAPPPYAAPPPPPPPPARTNRTWLIVIIVVLVLCCCCLAFLAFMYYVGGDWLIRQMQGTFVPTLPLLM